MLYHILSYYTKFRLYIILDFTIFYHHTVYCIISEYIVVLYSILYYLILDYMCGARVGYCRFRLQKPAALPSLLQLSAAADGLMQRLDGCTLHALTLDECMRRTVTCSRFVCLMC